ncbi:MAG: hypothetical protein RR461_04805, partial [Angelakisella sp.]
NLDFEVLFNELNVQRKFQTIITSDVLDWIRKYSKARLWDVLSLVNDLLKSTSIEISEYQNIPDDETHYRFQEILFSPNLNGINICFKMVSFKSGNKISINYPSVIEIEENNIRSHIHSKFYFICEDANKKRSFLQSLKNQQFNKLDDKESRLLLEGYTNTYRIIIYF